MSAPEKGGSLNMSLWLFGVVSLGKGFGGCLGCLWVFGDVFVVDVFDLSLWMFWGIVNGDVVGGYL